MAFIIDTGNTGGSTGPYLSYYSNGSAKKMLQPQTWAMREKGEDGNWTEHAVEAFASEKGCVIDIDSIKLGWEKDTATGPERRWNPSMAQATARPDDSKNDMGKFAWKQALSMRVALSGTEACTWEQGAFGAYMAFERLATQIMKTHPGDNTLPLVKMTGSTLEYKSNVPTLTVVKWVPRPDSLKVEAVIATAPAAPAPSASVDIEDAPF